MDGACTWPSGDLMVAYHDEEWGRPNRDPRYLFEFLVLEGAQAGLSWSTVLARREGYRRVFRGFDPRQVAAFTSDDVEQALLDPGVVRNRAKVLATVANAQAWLALPDPSGLLWSYVGGRPVVNSWRTPTEAPAVTDEAVAMSKGLQRLGFSFVGPTICYAFMQAVGMVNDHLVTCPGWQACQDVRQ